MIKALITLGVTTSFVASPLFTDNFAGFRADQLPIPQVDPPIQPAGWAFSIWGLIYGWLMVSALFGLVRRDSDPGWDAARPALIVALTLGSAYLPLATRSAEWSTVLIAGMLVSSLWALARTPLHDRLWLQTPVALLAGWLTAATMVSLGVTFAGHGIAFTPLGWAYVGILAALAIGSTMLFVLGRAPEYGAPIAWALFGIAMKSEDWALKLTCAAGIFALGAAVLLSGRKRA